MTQIVTSYITVLLPHGPLWSAMQHKYLRCSSKVMWRIKKKSRCTVECYIAILDGKVSVVSRILGVLSHGP